MTNHYPPTLPAEELTRLATLLLRGQADDQVNQVVHDAGWIGYYGLGLAFPVDSTDPSPPVPGPIIPIGTLNAAKAMTDDEVAAYFTTPQPITGDATWQNAMIRELLIRVISRYVPAAYRDLLLAFVEKAF